MFRNICGYALHGRSLATICMRRNCPSESHQLSSSYYGLLLIVSNFANDMAGPGRSRGRGRGRFGISPGLRPISEESRLTIGQQLEEFQRSNETSNPFSDISQFKIYPQGLICTA